MSNIKLNELQRKVVYADFEESMVIFAPPGAGKTTIMAKRINFLLNQKYIEHPYKILALTFSKAAANEMKKKIYDEMNSSKSFFHITTFHGFCFNVLKAYGNYIGLQNNFKIYFFKHNNTILFQAFQHFKLDESERNLFFDWKFHYILKCEINFEKNLNDKFLNVLKYYYSLLIENNLMDFEGLLIFTYKLFRNNDRILEYFRSPFKTILVDEFQDTNSLQFKILDLLVNGNGKNNKKNIFIFTDPKQSIYGFQGADFKNHDLAIKKFNCSSLKLEECHRFENKAIEQLSKAIDKFIEGNVIDDSELNINETLPKYFIFDNYQKECAFFINEINRFKNEGIRYENICVLAPSNKILKNLISRMKQFNFEDVIFINDYKDKWELQIMRLNKLTNNIDLNQYSNLQELFISNLRMHEYFRGVILKESQKFDRKYSNFEINDRLSTFINYMVLNYDDFFKNNNFLKNKIFLSTIHGSKGLQFDVSFVCGLNNKSIPFWKICQENCYKSNGVLDEGSLKLLNVAISRSKKYLYLSSINNLFTHETCILKPFYKYLDVIY